MNETATSAARISKVPFASRLFTYNC